jgi:hypothetical protein
MNEQRLIEQTSTPRTRESLAHDLRALGVEAGTTLEVHSSLSQFGWVCGGPVTVVQALMDVVTETGTLLMPTHTPNYTDPANWRNPPVPEVWWPILYEQMPAFDPRLTPSWGMGQVAETFRTWPGRCAVRTRLFPSPPGDAMPRHSRPITRWITAWANSPLWPVSTIWRGLCSYLASATRVVPRCTWLNIESPIPRL